MGGYRGDPEWRFWRHVDKSDPRAQRVLAREYGVAKSTIGRIRRRQVWAWL